MLGIRVDADNKIGTGHMMRCLAIADEARRQGYEVLFICSTDGDSYMIEQAGFRLELIATGQTRYLGECALIGDVLRKFNISTFLIDSYFVTSEYMECCRAYCKTVYIDDLHEKIWPCDVLINYSNYSECFHYQEEYPTTKLLLGCRYVPLKKSFSHVNRKIRESVSEILVLTGGTDPFHFARNLMVRIFSENDAVVQNSCAKKKHYTVVCGVYNEDRWQLEQMASNNSQLDVLFNVQDMGRLMERADIAVTAGGTTMYELAACGTPSICYSFADNQLQNTKSFADSGYMLYAGDLRKHDVVQSVLEDIDILANSQELRKGMSSHLQDLVDGNGAQRLVKALMEE